jgi:hypothetical protein
MIQGRSLAVDSSRNIYVGGWTQSGNFPTTANALQSVFAGTPNHDRQNAFIAKLGAAGLPNPESTSVQITRAWITGKKLFLAGNGFQANSVVMINGQAQATAYDPSSAGTSLIARRGGKIIQSGQTVILHVQSPDGMSNQYSFTKP